MKHQIILEVMKIFFVTIRELHSSSHFKSGSDGGIRVAQPDSKESLDANTEPVKSMKVGLMEYFN